MKTPDFILDKEYHFKLNVFGDPIILEKGCFVRPIHRDYVPKHILDNEELRMMAGYDYEFCYTHLGIIAIPSNIIVRK